MSTHSPAACPNCEAPLTDRYCASCGQDAHYTHPPTVGHFLHELSHEVLHVDGKIFRTIRALLFQPGLLTAEYWHGHVVSWIRPLRLFLIAAAIHLLAVQHGVGPLNFQVALTVDAQGKRDVAIGTDTPSMLKPGVRLLDDPEEREAYFQKFRKAYSAIRYSSVLAFALLAWLLYYRRHPYIVRHLILGLHYYSFWYLLAAAFSLRPEWGRVAVVPVAALYLLFAFRRVFGQGWPWTLAKAFVLIAGVLLIEGLLGLAAASAVERHWF